MSWIDDKAHAELARVREAREAGVYPFFRPFASGGLRTSVDGHAFVNFSSNDYLGLTTHPRVLAAAHEAVDRFACGLSSSRVQATTTAHVELEGASRSTSASRRPSSPPRATRPWWG
jgi:7-keto-8-aminopelargonate synthetase-like enzyme